MFCILNYGKKKEARIWEQIIFPYTKIESSDSIWNVIPIQVMAVLRDQNIIKKPKRPNLIQTQTGVHWSNKQSLFDLEELDHKASLKKFDENLEKFD